ncbi:MAG: polysaccharide deacetylase family protein [Clostridia bacterium]|nr:polysaccharide deacetylase family protein [Clostridia bacterium]
MFRLPVIYTCFPGGKHKVLTMSYDDGRTEDYRLVELFNKHGIKGTFNLNAGIDWDERRIPTSEYRTVYAGHEVACHTFTHPTISRCPLDQVAQQVLADRRGLEELMGYPVRGLAYPNGSYSQDIINLLPALGIRHARVVPTTGTFAMPDNFLEWKGTCHHNGNLMERARQFADLHKTQYLYMMYVWGHSYEFTDRDNWEVMEEFCEFIGGRDDIWYATNIEIVDYMDDASRLQYNAAGDMVYNPNARSVWIQVALPGTDTRIIEIPGGQTVRLFD